jgi:hypothetical protein
MAIHPAVCQKSGSDLKWSDALTSRDLDKQDWEVLKTLLKSYGTQINTTAARKGILKLYKGSTSFKDYFPEVSHICKILIKLTPKDCVTNLTFPQEIIQEEAGAAADITSQQDSVDLISGVNKQAQKDIGVRKLQLLQPTSLWRKLSLKDLNQSSKMR